jgi:hypothetical protein
VYICRGWKYDDTILLSNLDCTSLPMLRFIVQDKWWFNKDGKVCTMLGQ